MIHISRIVYAARKACASLHPTAGLWDPYDGKLSRTVPARARGGGRSLPLLTRLVAADVGPDVFALVGNLIAPAGGEGVHKHEAASAADGRVRLSWGRRCSARITDSEADAVRAPRERDRDVRGSVGDRIRGEFTDDEHAVIDQFVLTPAVQCFRHETTGQRWSLRSPDESSTDVAVAGHRRPRNDVGMKCAQRVERFSAVDGTDEVRGVRTEQRKRCRRTERVPVLLELDGARGISIGP